MKKKENFLMLLAIFALVFLTTNCTKNDDGDRGGGESVSLLNGQWNLNRVLGGFEVVDLEYDLGEVVWVFDNEKGMLTVEKNLTQTGIFDRYSWLDNGTYNFEVINENEKQKIYLDDDLLEIGQIISLSEEKLVIQTGDFDIITAEFIKLSL